MTETYTPRWLALSPDRPAPKDPGETTAVEQCAALLEAHGTLTAAQIRELLPDVASVPGCVARVVSSGRAERVARGVYRATSPAIETQAAVDVTDPWQPPDSTEDAPLERAAPTDSSRVAGALSTLVEIGVLEKSEAAGIFWDWSAAND